MRSRCGWMRFSPNKFYTLTLFDELPIGYVIEKHGVRCTYYYTSEILATTTRVFLCVHSVGTWNAYTWLCDSEMKHAVDFCYLLNFE